MAEGAFLGILQGITEWLPVSSEGVIVLARINVFGNFDIVEGVRVALFLHLGTFFAALVYFRNDVSLFIKTARRWRGAAIEDQMTLRFLAIATVSSGVAGGFIIFLFQGAASFPSVSGMAITIVIGTLLILTGIVQLIRRRESHKTARDLSVMDGVLLGFMQGIAILPGLSRSGLTVSTLLLRKFNDFQALRLSFLMSLPAVLLGNIVLNLGSGSFSPALAMGFLFAFAFGIATIHYLLRMAQRMNFGYFALIFGCLVFISAFF